jgi:hypothetical protein
MPIVVCYAPKRFSKASRETIRRANEIVADYQAQGLDLTLRQVYYQFVSRGWIPNNQAEYKRLGSILNNARLAGEMAWDSMEDRTRNLRGKSHWGGPSEIVRACASQYSEDLWASQDHYVEVWIEKDALVGVLEAVCPKNDVPYFSCRGYTSQSEMWSAAMRLNRAAREGNRQPVVIHLGDHDPSGVDMSRDIHDRLNLFSEANFDKPKFDPDWRPCHIDVRRIALTMAQVGEHNPPPNPAKMKDARAKVYVERYGTQSWELDALEPRNLIRLIQQEIDSCRDQDRWDEACAEQEGNRKVLRDAASRMTGPHILDVLRDMQDAHKRSKAKDKKRSASKGVKEFDDGVEIALRTLVQHEKKYLVSRREDE